MSLYTDYVGNPIKVGDRVVYPVKSGSSAATMVLAKVVDIVDIHPEDPSDLENRGGYTDDDIKNGRYPRGRTRTIPARWLPNPEHPNGPVGIHQRADDKAYILKVQRLQDGWGRWMRVKKDKITTVHNVTNVVVVEGPDGG